MKNLIYSCFFVLFFTTFLAAQTAPVAQLKLEPVTPHSLTTLGLTTNSVSPGLPVFANGTYVYLSANNVGSTDAITSSTFTLFSKPSGSAAVLEDVGSLGWKGLKADVKGAYKIELSVTTAGGSDLDTLTVYAGDYIGVGDVDGITGAYPSCMTCHNNSGYPKFQDIFTRWSTSGHATIFRTQIDVDAAASHYSTQCMKCHTTGYDHNVTASNNGFDDVALSLGWVYPGHTDPGMWDNIKTNYPGLVKFAVIGCENCHGAGSNHPAGQLGSQFLTNSTYTAGACAQCHDEPWRHNIYSMYENSGHSEAVWSNSFAQGASSQNNSLANCIRCHDAKGYINFTKGLTTNTTGMKVGSHLAITCQTCHDPHGNDNTASLRTTPAGSDTLANGMQYTLGGLGKTCMNCHKNRTNNEVTVQTAVSNSHWGPHHSVQADNFFGKNAAKFGTDDYRTNSHQFAVTDACVTCHMVATADTGTVNRDKVGGHSWNLHNPESGYDHTTACTSCHGPKNSFDEFEAVTDYDGDGSVESVQGEVEGLLTNIRVLLPPTGLDSVNYAEIGAMNDLTVKKAYWNYLLISYDGSNGMHNSIFAFDVLLKTEIALGGVVPVELVSFKAEVSKNGVTLKWETATETNNRGFEIERKISGSWAKIGFVEGKGTSTEFTQYSFTDKPNTSNVSYRLKQIDLNGEYTYSKEIAVASGSIPTEFSLSQNYPNPFNPSTTIKFNLPFDSKVKVVIYSINGEAVKVLADGEFAAGEHEAQFNTNSVNGLASGIYLYSINAVSNDGRSNFTQTKKMVLLK
ncbi:MAG: T9SS type A sorting domain-containing protein [Ignavibacteriaceae bacterium]